MDETPGLSAEQGTTKPSESTEEELVLPRLRVRFQDETSSEVRLHVPPEYVFIKKFRSQKKIFQNWLSFLPRSMWRFAP